MYRFRFAAALAALALVFAACSDDAAPVTTGGPAFEGVSWVVPDNTGKLVVSWKKAPDAVDYRVYVSRIQGRELKTAPAVRSDGTSVTITPDALNVRYFVIVRAANVSGVEDTNQFEKSAVASPDTTPPTFAGLKSVTPTGNAGVALAWDSASDDLTPDEAILYDVYAGRAKGDLRKVATTLPGDKSISFTQLGNPGESFQFAVKARDVAGNVSADVPPILSALGPDATPPTFGGCDTVTAQGSKAAIVTWKPGTDNATGANDLSYEIYLAKAAAGEDYNAAPAAKVGGGATSTTLSNLDPNSDYFVVCRARDAAGNIDPNTNEKTVKTGADVAGPTFAGLKDIPPAQLDGVNRIVTLEWAAATDDLTQQKDIVYDVFQSKASKQYDFNAPIASSAPGATSIQLKDLPSRSTIYWVVRARDASGNRDTNTVEKTGQTITSFSVDVQNIFDRNCAVIGCHVTGPAPAGLNLAPGFSYKALVGANAIEKSFDTNLSKRVPAGGTTDPAKNSYLWAKITGGKKVCPPVDPGDPTQTEQCIVGAQMPAPQTGNTLSEDDKAIIRAWMEGGALQN